MVGSKSLNRTFSSVVGPIGQALSYQVKKAISSEGALQALEAALQISETEPQSMTAVAINLGCSPSEVRKRFLGLCRAVSKRY